jgi:hypothetical protein
MNPQDVVSPISLPPTELERFKKRWVIYLERERITTDRQPTAQEVRDWCFVAGVPLADDESEALPAAPEAPADEEWPTLEELEGKKSRRGSASPALTPEQEALAKGPWTPEDRQAFEQWCSQQPVRRSPYDYSEREQTNWMRQRRGVPLLPPDPPREPMIWVKGSYQGMKGMHDYQEERRANDGFKRPGSFSTA